MPHIHVYMIHASDIYITQQICIQKLKTRRHASRCCPLLYRSYSRERKNSGARSPTAVSFACAGRTLQRRTAYFSSCFRQIEKAMSDNRRSRIRRHPTLPSTMPAAAVADAGAAAGGRMLVHKGRTHLERVRRAKTTLVGGGSIRCTPEIRPQKNQQTRPRPPVVVDRRSRRRRWPPLFAVIVAVAVTAVVLPRSAIAQYNPDTPLFEENMERAEEDLTASLKGGEYVEDVFFPNRQVGVSFKPHPYLKIPRPH